MKLVSCLDVFVSRFESHDGPNFATLLLRLRRLIMEYVLLLKAFIRRILFRAGKIFEAAVAFFWKFFYLCWFWTVVFLFGTSVFTNLFSQNSFIFPHSVQKNHGRKFSAEIGMTSFRFPKKKNKMKILFFVYVLFCSLRLTFYAKHFSSMGKRV